MTTRRQESGPTFSAADGRIKKGTGALVGNNVYNTTGTNQTSEGAAAPGKTITFTISIQNDAVGEHDSFALAVGESANYGYGVRSTAAAGSSVAKRVDGEMERWWRPRLAFRR